MYCPKCAFDNTQGLSYCKNCGANLNGEASKNISPSIVAIFLTVIGLITLAGFSMPMAAMSELSGKGFDKSSLMTFSFFFLLATFGIDFMLLRLLTRLLGLTKSNRQEPHPLVTRKPKYVTSEQSYQQLPDAPNSMTSVTEHTTRNFEPSKFTDLYDRKNS
jgi:hypothetical protein